MGCTKETGAEQDTIGSVLEAFPRLKPLLDRQGGALSGGEQQLLAIARCLCGKPRLVLLDEPTAGVNPVMIATMEQHVRQLHARGLTFLIVEHDMNFVMRVCDPIIVLDRGRPIIEGSPEVVQSDPGVLEAYLGD
jgi:ABC-type branched-subunit amino acid transport system ATPase component